MINFNEFNKLLTESFDSKPVPYRKSGTRNIGGTFKENYYSFTIDDLKYGVAIGHETNDGLRAARIKRKWSSVIPFPEQMGKDEILKADVVFWLEDSDILSREGRATGGPFDVTGTGNAGKVIMTVIQIIKDFIKIYNPFMISFTAEEKHTGKSSKARAAVYQRLVQRNLNKFPNGPWKQANAGSDKEFKIYQTKRK